MLPPFVLSSLEVQPKGQKTQQGTHTTLLTHGNAEMKYPANASTGKGKTNPYTRARFSIETKDA